MNTHLLIKSPARSFFLDLSVAMLSVSLAFLIKWLSGPYINIGETPFLFSFFAIMLSAWYGGLIPGLYATFFSSLVTLYYFLPPYNSFEVSSINQIYEIATFFLEGAVISYFWESLHRTIRSLQSTSTQLMESEQKYKMVVENSSDLIQLLDTRANILYVSPSFKTILGHSIDKVIGQNVFSFVHRDDFPMAKSEFEKTLLAGKGSIPMIRARNKEGSWILLESTGVVIYNKNHKPEMVLVTSRNVTEKKKYEEEIKEHLSLLHTVIEGISDGVFVKDLQGRYILINSAGAEHFGKSVDEIIGKTAYDFFPKENADFITRYDHQALEKEGMVSYDEKIILDGKTYTYLSSKSIYRNVKGDIVGLVGIDHDITERKQYEEKLEDLNKQIINILESITDAFFALDKEGKFVFINKQAEHLLQTKK